LNSEEQSEKGRRREAGNGSQRDPLYVLHVEWPFKKLPWLEEQEQNNWEVFHRTARSKIEAAAHFWALIIGMTKLQHVDLSMFNADTALNWYLDVFFYELVSTFDVLLQEMNVVYECGLAAEEVSWEGMKDKQGMTVLLQTKAPELHKLVAGEYGGEVFRDIRRCWRNIAAHRHHISKVSCASGWGGEFIREESTVELMRNEPGDNLDVSKLRDYVNFVADLASKVWHEFDKAPAGEK